MAGTNPPPLSVHVVWSAESEKGLAPHAGKALFDFLNFRVSSNQIQPRGAGIPVYLGTHLNLIEEWRDLCYPAGRAGASPPEPASDEDALYSDEEEQVNTRPCMIVVPILDREARINETFDAAILEWMEYIEKHQPQCNANLLLLPVPLTRSWLSRISAAIPPCRSAVWLGDDEARLRAIEEEVSLEVCHFLMDRAQWRSNHQPRNRVRIFISHAKADLDSTGRLAIEIRNYLATTGLKSFFDFNDIARGRDLESQLREGQRNSIFLAIHSDNYAESPYCLEEILVAKKYGVPLVVVGALSNRESRRPTYGGNSEVFVYKPEKGETFRRFITMRCLTAWLKHLHFHHAAQYAVAAQTFPVAPDFISRPPELLDFAHGLLPVRGPGLVFHPDPPLPQSESALLKKANPKLRLLTPTTALGNDLARNPAPWLNGYRVGLSLSNSPDLPGLEPPVPGQPDRQWAGRARGLVDAHYLEVTNHLTMILIRAGASLGYGGHLQAMGFTHFLSRLIGDHKRTNKSSQDLLYSYVARYIWETGGKDESDDIDARYIRCGDSLPEASVQVRQAVQLSQMRVKMADDCCFRVILGGKSEGYAGAFPGQAEEAWQHIELGKPLYIIGAFGGAAKQVAEALQGYDISPPAIADQDHYRELMTGFLDCGRSLSPEFRSPDSLKAMWERFQKTGRGYFDGLSEDEEKETYWTNGLSVADNKTLFTSSNPTEIVELILKGMQNTIRDSQSGDHIDDLVLFNGSIVDAPDVDAYAVAVMKGAPLKGADGALDASLGGELGRHLETRARQSAEVGEKNRDAADEVSVFSTRDSGLTGDWVLLYETPGFSSSDGEDRTAGSEEWRRQFDQRLQNGLSGILNKGDACGISSLAIVLFGANMGANLHTSVDAVLRAIHETDSLKTLKTIVLCEYDPDRYEHLRGYLRLDKVDGSEKILSGLYQGLSKDTGGSGHELRVSELPPSPPVQYDKKHRPIFLDIRRPEPGKIVCYAQTAGAGTAVSLQDTEVEWDTLMGMVHANEGRPPSVPDQLKLGVRLAQLVLPESVAAAIRRNPDRPVEVFHDIGAAALPFEMFRFQPDGGKSFSPSNKGGMRRLLLARNLLLNQRAYRRTFPLKVLLVTNPTGDLPAATQEGKALEETFEKFPDVKVRHLSADSEPRATKANVLKELKAGCAIFHYAGHAKFDADEPGKSGLLFPGNHRLTADDLIRHEIHENPPAVAVINACESAAVRSRVGGSESATGVSFAEWFLCCGLHAYIGNVWEVQDRSAKTFSTQFYDDVLNGKTLGDGVLRARQKLAKKSSPDWCNYVLYGNADLRI